LQLRFEARNQTRRDCGNITTGASQGLRQHECRAQSEASRAQTALNHFKRSRVCLTVEHRNRHRTEEHGAGFLLLEDDRRCTFENPFRAKVAPGSRRRFFWNRKTTTGTIHWIELQGVMI